MRIAPLLLGWSLAVNIAMAFAVYARWPGSPAELRSHENAEERAAAAAPLPEARAANAAPTPTALAPDLAHLATLSDESYVAALRARGFPGALIRALVDQRIRQRYAERMRSARRPREYAYWRREAGSYDPMSREERAAVRAISKEISDEVTRLLGGAGVALSSNEKSWYEHTLSFLATDKIQQLNAVIQDYGELMSQVRERTKGLVLRADREELRLLEREQRADLAALFTSEELFEYDLRMSPTASGLRSRMTYFEPSEAEYRALVAIQLEVDQRFGTNLSADEQVAKRALEQEIPAKFAAALGPERYLEFQVTTDGSFRDTLAFLRNAGLDPGTAKDVIAVKREVTQRADAIQLQRELSPAQRAEALAVLEREAMQRLAARLDEKTLADYEKYSAGGWLARLRPRVAPANP